MHKMMSVIVLLSLSSWSLNAFSAKQDVCHKGKNISVAEAAVSAHLAHGDSEGTCSETPPMMAAVVMMRCEPIVGNGVEVVSASSSTDLADDVAVILPIPPPIDTDNDPDCANALAALLKAGYKLKSITTGSAQSGVEDDEDLHLYIDYLLIGKVPEEI